MRGNEARRGGMPNHEHWDELAAGHALHALEPAEAAEFDAHRGTCARCQQSADEMSFVAAQLGSLAGSRDTEAPPWPRLRAAVIGSDAAAPVASGSRAWRPKRWLLPAATAAAVVAAVSVAAVRLTTTGGSAPLTVAACQRDTACHQVVLRTAAGAGAATVLVRGRSVVVASVASGAAAPGTEWVLWQQPRGGQPEFVRSFSAAPSPRSGLTTSYAQTAAFALSAEPAGTHPDRPSRIVATAPAG